MAYEGFDYWYAIQQEKIKAEQREKDRRMLEDEELRRLRHEVNKLRLENADLNAGYDLLKAACLIHEKNIGFLQEQKASLKLEVQSLKVENGQLNIECADKETKIQKLQEADLFLNGKLERICLEQTEKFKSEALKLLFPSLKEENASLKLEVQKLKGLIEAAQLHVGIANLMLA